MKEEILTKAPGMKFVVDLRNSDKKKRMTPRVIHALGRDLFFFSLDDSAIFDAGNIKWGFSDGKKPLPIEKIQSKWDKEHNIKAGQDASADSRPDGSKDEYVLTSMAVSWPKVSPLGFILLLLLC